MRVDGWGVSEGGGINSGYSGVKISKLAFGCHFRLYEGRRRYFDGEWEEGAGGLLWFGLVFGGVVRLPPLS